MLVKAEHNVYFLVVSNGTNNYVNHFCADIWKVVAIEEIRMNVFQFPMWLACNQSKKWREFKWQYSLAAIDGEISAIDFYLTLSHRVLYKEVKFQAIHGMNIGGNIMLVKFL